MSYRRRRNGKNNTLPERWNDYTPMGNVIPGTPFLPFKTPLKEEICNRSVLRDDWFTPAMLLEMVPNLKFVIDLTHTDRYYAREEFLENGVGYEKIWCPGGGQQLPPSHIIQKFMDTIDSFLESEAAISKDFIIGIHCTHGLNRTGYLICKYMVHRFGFPAHRAIEAFENARGYKIERDVYKNDLLGRSYYAEPEEQPHYWNPPSRSRDRRSYYSSHNRNSRNNNSRYSRRDAYHY